MGGGTGGTQASQNSLAQAQTSAAMAAQAQSTDLYNNFGRPGIEKAYDYYSKLASGDTQTMFNAVAPAAEQVKAQSEAAKQSILASTPRGGAQDLALGQADVTSSANIGHLISSAYTNSFPALGSLGGQNIGFGIQDMNQALQGLSSAGQTYSNVGQEQAAGKASTMGFLGSLAGGAGTTAGGIWCWIAKALYGNDDPRVALLRAWLKVWADRSLIGKAVTLVYARYGERVALLVPRYRLVRFILRPLFDWGVRVAYRELCQGEQVACQS